MHPVRRVHEGVQRGCHLLEEALGCEGKEKQRLRAGRCKEAVKTALAASCFCVSMLFLSWFQVKQVNLYIELSPKMWYRFEYICRKLRVNTLAPH